MSSDVLQERRDLCRNCSFSTKNEDERFLDSLGLTNKSICTKSGKNIARITATPEEECPENQWLKTDEEIKDTQKGCSKKQGVKIPCEGCERENSCQANVLSICNKRRMWKGDPMYELPEDCVYYAKKEEVKNQLLSASMGIQESTQISSESIGSKVERLRFNRLGQVKESSPAEAE